MLDCPFHTVVVSSSPAVDSAVSVYCLAPGTDDLSSQPGYVALYSASAVDCCLSCITDDPHSQTSTLITPTAPPRSTVFSSHECSRPSHRLFSTRVVR